MNGQSKEIASYPQSIFVLAGDQSGDNHAAPIIARLKSLRPDLRIWGVGGPQLKAAGMDLLYDYRQFSGFGFQHVINNLAFFRRLITEMTSLIKERRPTLVLLVDYGAVGLRIARQLRKSMPELPIYQFISPQIWASRPWRANTIKDNNIQMLVIFRFEELLYRNKGIKAKFVGHPLARSFTTSTARNIFCDSVGLNSTKPIVAIFPGSRKQEISYILPPSLEAISVLQSTHSDIQYVISVADPLLQPEINSCLKRFRARTNLDCNPVLLPASENDELMSHCDLAWAKSGTTTLEVALFGKPMLVYYKGSWLDHLVVRLFKTTKLVGMPNILAGREIVPELLQNDCNPGLIARMTKYILDNPSVYRDMSSKLSELRNELGSFDYVSECIGELLVSLPLPSQLSNQQ